MGASRRLVSLLLFVFLLVACGGPTSVVTATMPTVRITAPSDGQHVQEGQQLSIHVTASDPVGVARMEVGVDSVLLGTPTNPSPSAGAPFSVQQEWTASTPGSHTVMAVAYNTAGHASPVAIVNVTVVGTAPTDDMGATLPPPSSAAPTDEAAVLTATWTPIALSTPTSPSTPTRTPLPTATSKPPPTTQTRPASPGPITGFEDFGSWRRGDQPYGTFAQSAEHVHSGAYSGKLAYDFPSGGNDFVVFLQTFLLGGRPNQISAWVYGDGSKHYLNVWIKDAAGEIWQFPLGQAQHTGWQQMTARLDPTMAWPAGHIDGPSNGVVEYPIDFRAVVLDDIPDTFRGGGTIYLDDLRCDEVGAP